MSEQSVVFMPEILAESQSFKGREMNLPARLDYVRQVLAETDDIREVKKLRDEAETLREHARKIGLDLRAQNEIAEVKLCTERRAGELLGEREKSVGGRPTENRSHDVTSLSDLGISKIQSSRWQAIAGIPLAEFERYIAQTKEIGEELTSVGARALAKALRDKQNGIAPILTDIVVDVEELIEQGTKFGTVYADPPWSYDNKGTRACADGHYPTMSIEEIAAMPVREVVADNAHLHLWTTNAFLFDAKGIIESWGFEYKSCFVWVKPTIGIGNYWRVSHEFLLLGVRGQAPFRDKTQRSWLEAKRTTHSSKPGIIRKIIEQTSPAPYLELFARDCAKGWVSCGNEAMPNLFVKGGELWATDNAQQ